MKKLIFHSVAVVFLCTAAADAYLRDYKKEKDFLLPGDVIPIRYDIRWAFEDNCCDGESIAFGSQFVGKVQIQIVAVRENVTVLELSANDLIIHNGTISAGNGSSCGDVINPSYNKNTRKVVFALPYPLPKFKPIFINLTFRGKIYKIKHMGIYQTEETVDYRVALVQRSSLGTRFQPAEARRAFPCFDEPRYKATFRLSLNISSCLVANGYSARSNTKQESEQFVDGRVIVFFKETVVMSSYLVAFVVTNFRSTEVKYFNSSYPEPGCEGLKEFRTWGPPSVIGGRAGAVAQIAGPLLMEIYTEYLQVGYPLEKMDQIAIFKGYSGMENWGLVSYGFPFEDLNIVELLSHELSHQWFGNLLTTHWWSDTWMNEGFAVFFSMFGSSQIQLPQLDTSEWMLPQYFAVFHVQKAMGRDFGGISHPLTSEVYDPRDYIDMFDTITYDKGGAVLLMWSRVLGLPAFLKALNTYLRSGVFEITTPEYLFSAFDSVAAESISNLQGLFPSQIFPCWHLISGYPLVEVTKSTLNPCVYVLRQSLFRIFGKGHDQKWTIPITYATREEEFEETHAKLWFNAQDEVAMIVLPAPVNWIVLNNQLSGFYRVNYDKENWDALCQILRDPNTYESIHVTNRAQIIDDVFHIARSGLGPPVDYDFALSLALYLKHETNYYPWKAALNSIEYLNKILVKNPKTYAYFKQYVRILLRNTYEALSFNERETDSYLEKKLRREIVYWSCKMDNPECIRESFRLAANGRSKKEMYDDALAAAQCTTLRVGEKNSWDALYEKYLTASENDKLMLIRGVGCLNDEYILRRALTSAVDESKEISSQHRELLLSSILNGNPENVNIVFRFVRENYRSIEAMFTGHKPVSQLLIPIAECLATDEEVLEMRQFAEVLVNDKAISLRGSDVPEALNIIDANNAWLKGKNRQVEEWLVSFLRET